MGKDFEGWGRIKEQLHSKRTQEMYFREKEVWWCALGLNIGDEQDGKGQFATRPVLVIKKFNKRICIVLPLSTKTKQANIYYLQE